MALVVVADADADAVPAAIDVQGDGEARKRWMRGSVRRTI